MNQNGNGKPDPVQWPTVTIGGKEYTLKFRGLQVMLFQDRQLAPAPGQEPPAPITVRTIFEQIASAVSNPERIYTPEDIADLVEIEDFPAVRQGMQLFDMIAVCMSTPERSYTRQEVLAMIEPSAIGSTMTAMALALGKARRPGMGAPLALSAPEKTSSAIGLN